ncbi:MAG: response regulator [Proteobacteria bacterium]|nr:response regulator [Pseudomonadota bacterium]
MNRPAENITILIIDDDMEMRFLLSTIIKGAGYRALTVKDGKEGMASLSGIKPDLIVLDVMMPEEGGSVVYRRLKTSEELKKIPVIIVSGVSRYTFYHYLSMINMKLPEKIPLPEAYIEKPPAPELLVSLVAKLLESG